MRRPALVTLFWEMAVCTLGYISTTSSDVYDIGGERVLPNFMIPPSVADKNKVATSLLDVAQTFLVLINSPRIIGRKQHMPNVGLEKRLLRSLAGGKFPLHAWTEIKLQVAKPPEIDDGEPHETHLTGKRALHFVRKHLRIRLGQLEYVSAHWRGDPSIGIKRSRYIVKP